MMARILVLNPVSTSQWDEVTRRYLESIASPSTKVVVRSLEGAPESIETIYDAAVASRLVAEEAERAEKEGFDAMVVNCFDDPGVDAAREKATRMLVLGAGEASMITALLLGYRIAIVSTGPNAPALYHRRAMELGFYSRLAYVGYIDVGVLDLRRDEDKVLGMLEEEARRAIEAGAEVIVLGCTGFIGMGEKLSRRINAPVVDPAPTAFKLAEALVGAGLRHSKKHLYNVPVHKRENR